MSRPSVPSAFTRSQSTGAVRTEHVRCVVCGGDRARSYRAGMYRIDDVRFDLVRCACGMVYVDPRPDGPTLARMYADPSYYDDGYNLGVETENYFARRAELIAQYEGVARALARETGKTGDLLELGSAGGFFLEGARHAGFRVRGIELSPAAVEYSRRELGLDVFEGELASAPYEPASFDVAYADNVLEHTPAPHDVLLRLRDLLRPGGHLVVIVPAYVNSIYFRTLLCARRVVPRRFLGRQTLRLLKLDPEYDGGHPYHILEFDRTSLTTLLRRAGFEIVRVEASVPYPAHIFKVARTDVRTRVVRAIFRVLNGAMHLGALPGARIRVLARRA